MGQPFSPVTVREATLKLGGGQEMTTLCKFRKRDVIIFLALVLVGILTGESQLLQPASVA